MANLLIMADDLTGAIDTGVQLAKQGASTHVMTDLSPDFIEQARDCDVLVINTETRHCEPKEAYLVIRDIAEKAKAASIRIIYKKTDSALRGNIGAELEGLIDGCENEPVYFAPAFPALGRYTKKGQQLIQGVPVNETVFGKDPFEPATDSYLPSIIAAQSKASVVLVEESESIPDAGKGAILVFDATSDARLATIAKTLAQKQQSHLLLAGCAGFAQHLGDILGFQSSNKNVSINGYPGVLVVSGSLNPITTAQIASAKEKGFSHIALNEQQRLNGITDDGEGEAFVANILRKYRQSGRMIVEANGETRRETDRQDDELALEKGEKIASNIGRLIARLIDGGFEGTVVVTGGDTLKGVLNSMRSNRIRPICEIEPGVALATAQLAGRELHVVTKSGGFGSKEVFSNIYTFIQTHSNPGDNTDSQAIIMEEQQA